MLAKTKRHPPLICNTQAGDAIQDEKFTSSVGFLRRICALYHAGQQSTQASQSIKSIRHEKISSSARFWLLRMCAQDKREANMSFL